MTSLWEGNADSEFILDKPKYNDIWAGLLVCPILPNDSHSLIRQAHSDIPRLRCCLWHLPTGIFLEQKL